MYLFPGQLEFFNDIQDPELVKLIDDLPLRKYPKGIAIVEEGENSDDIYGILHGGVDVVRRNVRGDLEKIAELTPGKIFGEFSYFTGEPRANSVICHTDTVILEMSSSWLMQATKAFPVLKNRIEQLYVARTFVNILSQTKLFKGLSNDEISRVVRKFELKAARSGDVLIQEGASDLDLIVIKSGTVGVFKKQGAKNIELAKLSRGEVLGEMAIVSGEPRSASVVAVDDVEYMVLPGLLFKSVLVEFPRVLDTIKEIIEIRSLQNQKVLEEFSSKIFAEPSSLDDDDGILLSDLNVKAIIGDVEGSATCKILRFSADKCVLEGEIPLGSTSLRFAEPKQKLLKDLAKLPPMAVKISKGEGGTFVAKLDKQHESHKQVHAILPKLAQAKLNGLIYPEYDAKPLNVNVQLKLKSRPSRLSGQLTAASLTGGKASLSEPGLWSLGEVANLVLTQVEKQLLETKALSISILENGVDFQFEFESKREKEDVEQLISILSGGSRIVRAISQKSEARAHPNISSAPMLTRRFSSTTEFMRTFLTSIDAGLLKVVHRAPLKAGTHVRVTLIIPENDAKNSERKISCQGAVKDYKENTALIALDDSQHQLRERLEKICRETVEKKSTVTWEERKNELLGISTAVTQTKMPLKVQWLLLFLVFLAIVGVYVLWYVYFFNTGIETNNPWHNS